MIRELLRTFVLNLTTRLNDLADDRVLVGDCLLDQLNALRRR